MCDNGLPKCDDVCRNLGGEMLVVHVKPPEKAREDKQLWSMLDEALVPPPVWRSSRDAAIQLYKALPDVGKSHFAMVFSSAPSSLFKAGCWRESSE